MGVQRESRNPQLSSEDRGNEGTSPPNARDPRRGGGPMTGQEMKRFSDALLGAFDERSLTRMVFYAFDKSLANIVSPGPLEHVVFELIRLAHREGWLSELRRAACDEVPGNAALQ